MNYIDIIIGVFLLWGFIRGFSKGLFVSLASLVALTVGIYIAVHFSYITGEYLEQYVDWQDGAMKFTAFTITFVIVILMVSLSGKLLTKIANFVFLGLVNKILGAIFGVLKSAFIVSVVIMLLDAANKSFNMISQETLNDAVLYAPVSKLAPMVLPNILDLEK